ncbi:Hsp70 family protein [Amycolatopsis sp. NPDC004079]|uniref:Hsp70 family protein n=1 Tax=Amycolatopsis sp. NPDC004079 TaxID=3154549 RepID=UPI0033A2C747
MTVDDNRAFGIDLGTTHSCIAYVDEASGLPSVVTNAEGDLTTPSVVLFEGADRVVGKEAKNAAVMYADRVVSMVKRHMGLPDWRFGYEGQQYPAEEISSYVLRKIAADAETLTGSPVKEVVITCPAYFGIAEREATAKAGEIAGLTVLEVINEPTAAAISYGVHTRDSETVLVYDLGGGTFDVTLIKIEEGSVCVRATDGDHQLGGRDWDTAVVNYLAGQWQEETGSPEDPHDSEETLQDLWQRAEDGKRALSTRQEVSVLVSHEGQRASVKLSREKFAELTAHLLERTVDFTKAVLAIGAERGIDGFDKLLLVGGSARMPQVRERLAAEFGVEPVMHDPDQSVAKGAAIYAHKLKIGAKIGYRIDELMSARGESADGADQPVPEEVRDRALNDVADETGLRREEIEEIDSFTVTNVASKSFGIIVLSGRGEDQRRVVANLVLAQEEVPVTKSQTFYTTAAGVPHVNIDIMENTLRDQDAEIEQSRQIGIAVLPLSPGLPIHSPVDVTFALRQDGRLKVTGQDVAEGGKQAEAIIETDRGLSDEELQRAKDRATGLTVSG